MSRRYAHVKDEILARGYSVVHRVLGGGDVAAIKGRLRYIAAHARFYRAFGVSFTPAPRAARRARPDPLEWFEQIGNVPFLDPECRARLLAQADFAELAQAVVGGDADVINAGFFLKAPHGGAEVPWHQDAATWGVPPGAWAPGESPLIFDYWLALDDADAGNGALELLPESQRCGVVRHERRGGLLPEADPAAHGCDPQGAVTIRADTGDVVVYHHDMFHRSGRNDSGRGRLAAAGTLVDPQVSARLRALLPHYATLDRCPLYRDGRILPLDHPLPPRASAWRWLVRKTRRGVVRD
jgi:ectoine hydroxylase-related dioxygenase (phytanoyl-CoA dioxygenase family)